jgi:dTDP-4-dehydrorhamnose reductase
MRLILLGATGYIGEEFCRQLNLGRNATFRVPHEEATFGKLSYAIEWWHTELVINCAAFVTKPSVELCEDHKADCLLGNTVFPAQVAAACQAADVPLLHVSTGCLYDDGGKEFGTPRMPPFKESDPPMLTFDRGAGYYVGSKELAERLVRQYEKTWICRVRLPFDQYDHPRNFLSKLLSFSKVLDTRNSMSHRGDFVKACLDLIELSAPFGTYNMTNPGAVWTHDICDRMNTAGMSKGFTYWEWDEFVQNIRRTPMSNAELDVSKLLATGVKMRTVQEAIEDSINNWRTT